MGKRNQNVANQVLLFPQTGEQAEIQPPPTQVPVPTSLLVPATAKKLDQLEIVISGSFRKDVAGLKSTFEELQEHGFKILSPLNVSIVSEKDGFVFMEGEQTESPESIEQRHLHAITRAAFVWLHAPEGYIGPSAALEIGFARAHGIPVYTSAPVAENPFKPLVTVVPSLDHVVSLLHSHPVPPLPAVQAFQAYYAKAAVRRGYDNENARDCLLLMLEEFGELARALRKRAALRRDSAGRVGQEDQELADIFIYVVHMANVLGLDLAEAVRAKEHLNIQRFLTR